MKPSTPKGTRDFSPAEMARRNYIFDTVKAVFRLHGFAQIETPAMENTETLMGKYGEEGDRLIFKILNSGDYWQNLGGLSLVEEVPELRELLLKIQNSLPQSFERYFGGFETATLQSIQEGFGISDRTHAVSDDVDSAFNWGSFTDSEMFDETFAELLLQTYWNWINEFDDSWDVSYHSRLSKYGKFYTEDQAINRLVVRDFEQFVDGSEKFRSIILMYFSMIQHAITKRISEKALRYDLTVPFARYVVQHRNDLTFPFKRFQIQPVWRADRPQKGRYREFYQCDIDVIGSDSLLNEVELIQVADAVFSRLDIPVTIKINNRKILMGLAQVIGAPDNALLDIAITLDKLDKLGELRVIEELRDKGYTEEAIEKLKPTLRFSGDNEKKIDFLQMYLEGNEIGQKGIAEVRTVIGTAQSLISPNTIIQLDLTLARGLNYYTGAIFEVRSNIEGTLSSSISGGGRYDDLTGIFGMPNVSGVGISFGADRIYDVLLEAGLFPSSAQEGTKVLFVNFGEQEALHCLPLVKAIREAGISAELYPDAAKLKKQFGHADSLGIPFVAMVGESEMAENVIALKDMRSGEQVRVTLEEVVKRLG